MSEAVPRKTTFSESELEKATRSRGRRKGPLCGHGVEIIGKRTFLPRRDVQAFKQKRTFVSFNFALFIRSRHSRLNPLQDGLRCLADI